MLRSFSLLLIALILPFSSASAQLLDTAERDDRLGQVATTGDFNGDGFLDLAIGVPEEDVDRIADAGAVHVIYGTADGLQETGMQFWTQNDKGTPNAAGVGDAFGAALAAVDLNNDGFEDLAIGAPGESFGAINEAGAVLILLGTDRGLSTNGSIFLNQTLAGMPDQAENNDRFGAALAGGDFDNDGFGDLAIGVPGENIGNVVGAGAVHVFLGGNAGYTPAESQFFHQNVDNISDNTEGGDGFGGGLVAGNFNGDGFDDLAIGVPEEDVAAKTDAGALHILYGQASGLAASGSDFLHQDVDGVEGEAADFELFGRALAAGDVQNDGRDDLAVGIAFEAGSTQAAGSVQIFIGAADGLGANDQIWNQDTAGLGATATPGDLFGWAIALADVNGDGFDDLAAGVPGKTLLGLSEAGGVFYLPGSASGITVTGSLFWQQNSLGTLERNETGDFAGAGLSAGDFDGDGRAELMVGVPQEDDGGVIDIGKYHLLRGSAAGPAGLVRDWAQNSLPERPEIVDPEDNETIVVGGLDTPLDPATPFEVFWSESGDADGHNVTYYWQLSLTPNFNLVPLNIPVGTATRYQTTVGDMGRVMGGIGIFADSSFTFYHRVVATDGRGQSLSTTYAVTLVRGQIVANEADPMALDLGLEPNFPNPFQGSTTIAYTLDQPGTVRLEVFDMLGRRVQVVIDGSRPAGRHEEHLDLGGRPSGVYLVRLTAGSAQRSRPILLQQ